jgi:hypothetical protein
MMQEIEGRLSSVAPADVLVAIDSKLLLTKIASVAEAIREKEQGIAGFKLQRGFIVCCDRKGAGRQARDLKDARICTAEQKRAAEHSSADNANPRASRIEQGILKCRMSPGNASEQEALVQKGKHSFGLYAGFVDSAERADGERRIKRRGEALPGDVANVQADDLVAELEVVEVVASHFRDRLELVRDSYACVAQGMRGRHDVLNDASFLEFLLAKLFNRMQIQRQKRGVHEPIRRGE